ncbi:MAG: pyridoxal-dependent decarboxylase [Bacteroidota bacterium]
MNHQLSNDLAQLADLLEAAKQHGITYLSKLDTAKTASPLPAIVPDVLPEDGIGAQSALQRFQEKYGPLIVAASGPRYWGYVTGGTTPAAMVGDWLATVIDQNPQAIRGAGDISANIELQTVEMLLDLFQLSQGDFFGGFVTGATMSNFTCLGVARQWYGRKIGMDIARNGITDTLHILSATPHSSAIKVLSMLGVGSANVIEVKTLAGNREAMDTTDLQQKLIELNGQPAIVISSGGTVNTVDFDDFTAIARLRQSHDFWWHIDAAFGGFAACSEQYRHLLTDWHQADSITIDGHKWMNVPYESAMFFVKKKHSTLQRETFQNTNAPYLGNPLENFSYLNLLPENSRRLKALPAWFSLQAYGREGYRDIVENCIQLAQELGRRIAASSSFKLLAPVRLNNICFTLREFERDEEVQQFLDQLNQAGQVFMTPTRYRGVPGIRCSLVNWRTTEKDIDLVFNEMNRIVKDRN